NKNYRNSEQDRRLEKIEKHIETINHELGDIKVDITKIKGKIGWQMWLLSGAAAVIGFLISKLF
ncbi:MAG: hypothetical protein JSV32_01995, partial [Dehalococcoidia bacterium]